MKISLTALLMVLFLFLLPTQQQNSHPSPSPSPSPSPPPALQHLDLITRTCLIIDYTDTCSMVLKSDPRSANATTVKDLAYISLDLSLANATATLKQIHKLRTNKSSSSLVKQALKHCEREYRRAINDYFGNAIGRLDTMEYPEARALARTGGNFGVACELEFYFMGAVYRSPLWEANHNLMVVGQVAEGVIEVLIINDSVIG